MVVAKPGSSNGHVLVVDSNRDESRLLVDVFRRKNYRVSVAFSGVQGYDRAVAVVPDLVLLDVGMSDVCGFATFRKFKANPLLAPVPVIFLGVAHDASQRLHALEIGAVDYVLKPYAPEEVLARACLHLAFSSNLPPVLGRSLEPPDRDLDFDQVLVRAAQQYLTDNLSVSPSLRGLARLLGINEKRLSRAFQKCLNLTVFEYLRQQRMQVAQRLLRETTLSIVSISQEVGFSRAANFSTAFRYHVGVSPSKFRKVSALCADTTPVVGVPEGGGLCRPGVGRRSSTDDVPPKGSEGQDND